MLPVLFKIGSFEVRSFSVIILIAVFAGIWLIRRRAHKYDVPVSELGDLLMWTVIVGVLGARLLYIAQEFRSMKTSEILSFRFEGLTSFGGNLDLMMPAMLLGQAIGRIACFFNGCCYGVACPANFPLGIHVPGHDGEVHPAQLYETAFLLPLLWLLLWFENRDLAKGRVAMLGFAFLGIARFLYEFWRAGTVEQVNAGAASSTYWGGLPITQAQAVALAMVLIGAVGWVLIGRSGRRPAPVANPN
jgi:phosphatidylglycerol:prolipoprotein diacylglycerol transferase